AAAADGRRVRRRAGGTGDRRRAAGLLHRPSPQCGRRIPPPQSLARASYHRIYMRFLTVLLVCPFALVLAQTPTPGAPVPPGAVLLTRHPPAEPQVAPDKVILTIGVFQMTAAMFNQIIDSLPPQVQAAARGASRKQYAENLVKIFVLAQ